MQYAGRVYDEREMVNMVDAVLDFWLTAGRFAEDFEEKLGAFIGAREVIPGQFGIVGEFGGDDHAVRAAIKTKVARRR